MTDLFSDIAICDSTAQGSCQLISAVINFDIAREGRRLFKQIPKLILS